MERSLKHFSNFNLHSSAQQKENKMRTFARSLTSTASRMQSKAKEREKQVVLKNRSENVLRVSKAKKKQAWY